MDKIYYVYEHIRLDTNEVFYVGIGTKNIKPKYKCKIYQRAYFKSPSKRSNFWYNVYTKCNKNIQIKIVYETNNLEEVKNKEIELILLYGKKINNSGTLVNISDGGEGGFGIKWSDEQKKNRSEKMKGKNNHFYNKQHTNKTKEYLSEINKGIGLGENNNFYGKKHTKETKEKLCKKGKERWENGTLPKLPIMKGSANVFAKKVLAINHNTNKKYFIHGEIKGFCDEYNLSYSVYKRYVNKGIYHINPNYNLNTVKNKNTTNWEFINNVDETKYNNLIIYHHLSSPSK